ncbi:unnamed protein product, partial [Ectocarpus sp. 13 AM-2016]
SDVRDPAEQRPRRIVGRVSRNGGRSTCGAIAYVREHTERNARRYPYLSRCRRSSPLPTSSLSSRQIQQRAPPAASPASPAARVLCHRFGGCCRGDGDDKRRRASAARNDDSRLMMLTCFEWCRYGPMDGDGKKAAPACSKKRCA